MNMELKKCLHLNWKKAVYVLLFWFACVIMHNLIYALFGIEEVFFFVLAVIVIPLYSIIGLFYTVSKKCLRKL